jgi:hypothetical protein
MRRKTTFMRSRILPVLTAGLIGYLIGGWQPVGLSAPARSSAADNVALRFPRSWDATSPAAADDSALASSGVLNKPDATDAAPSEAQRALLDPQPMVRQISVPQISVPQVPQPVAQTSQDAPRVQLASAEMTEPPAAAVDSSSARRPQPQQAMPARPQRPVKAAAAAAPPHAPIGRPGYMFDDAQIASIKARLHLTPDQEQMWPAVEAALRNIAYTRMQQSRSRATQPAQIDPDSVDGLKSAAVPLIMSFDDDQKQEVRNLAHVMGLDQLASQF